MNLFNLEIYQDGEKAIRRCKQLLADGFKLRKDTQDQLRPGYVDFLPIYLHEDCCTENDHWEVVWMRKDYETFSDIIKKR